MKEKENQYFISNQTFKNIFCWEMSYTGGVSFEKNIYCVDSNHYITEPKWKICEICNSTIQERQ